MVAAFARTHLGINPLRRRGRKMKQFGEAKKEGKGKDKDKNKERFEVPYFLHCKECYSAIAKGVKLIIGSKKAVGYYRSQQIWRYYIECPCCGYDIVMESTSRNSFYKIVKGADKDKHIKKSGGASGDDFESQQKEHNLKYLGSMVPASSVRFKVPFRLECQGCNSIFSKDLNFNGKKKSVGNYRGKEIWRYFMECPCCRYIIVMERASDENSKFDIVDGGKIYVPPDPNVGTSLVHISYVDPTRSFLELAAED